MHPAGGINWDMLLDYFVNESGPIQTSCAGQCLFPLRITLHPFLPGQKGDLQEPLGLSSLDLSPGWVCPIGGNGKRLEGWGRETSGYLFPGSAPLVTQLGMFLY